MPDKARIFRPAASWLPGGGRYDFVDLAFLGALLVVWALSEAKAIQSIASGLVVLGALGHGWRQGWQWRQRWALWLVIPFGLSLVAGPFTSTTSLWWRDLWQKLPFLALGLSLAVLPPFRPRQYQWVWGGFVVIQSLVALLTLGRFFGNYAAAMEAVRQNAEIDIVGSISHIYFGILLALSVFLGGWLAWQEKGTWLGRVMLGLSLFNAAALHMLTSRTGLLAFYLALMGTGAVLVYRRRAWRLGLGLMLLMAGGLSLSYWTIPSFRTRVQVTFWDLQGYRYRDRDLSHHSATLRLLAWETAVSYIAAHPWGVTGIAELEPTLRAAYRDRPLPVAAEALPGNPHNQYLEYGIAFGLWGMALLVLMCLLPVWSGPRPPHLLTISFLILIMGGMLTESLLERQAGMYTLIFFMALLPGYQQAQSSI
ncbi:MAG: O-antigen ligase family protein [Bacteroidetes bacterium]|nr:MAG: O-antigen ligase family protein [Bacteroidota bacterium]